MWNKEGIVQDKRELLRVKLKSLAAESRIIRGEEARCFSVFPRPDRNGNTHDKKGRLLVRRVMRCEPIYSALHDHRVRDVRREARITHLAYGLIRGRSIEKMEQMHKVPVNENESDRTLREKSEADMWNRVHAMVKKYGPPGFKIPERKAA